MNQHVRALIAVALLALSAVAAAAEQIPKTLVSGIPHQALFSIAMDGNDGLAVGAGGEVQVTADGGVTWARQATPSPLALLGATVAGGRMIAVGQMGLVLISGGDSQWQVVETGTTERLMSVSLNADGLAVAVGSFGTVLRSTDAGRSWTSVQIDFEPMYSRFAEQIGLGFSPHLYAVKLLRDGSAILAGELSTIAVSDDGGQQWRPTHIGSAAEGQMDPSLFGLDVREDGLAFAVGQAGRVMRSEDRGEYWEVVATDSNANFLGVGTSPSGRVVVVGMREVIASRDGGGEWERLPGPDIAANWYSDATHLVGGKRSLAVGHSGRIIAIEDAALR